MGPIHRAASWAGAALGLAALLHAERVVADVAVLVGSPDGRAAAEPDPRRVNEPFAVAFDASGAMYGVEYTRGNRLFRVPAGRGDDAAEFVAGRFHLAGPRDAVPPDTATSAADVRFVGLHDVAVGRDGLVYVADTFRHRIRAYDPRRGTVTSVAGSGEQGFSGDGGPAVAARFDNAYCSALVPDGAALLVADIANHRLRRVDLRTGTVATVVGRGTRGQPIDGAAALDTPLAGPRAACVAGDGTIYLALREGNALVEIRQGKVRTVVNASGQAGYAGDGGPGRAARLAGPKYVAVDRAGRVLIADTENHCIRRWDPATGRIALVAGTPTMPGVAVGRAWSDTRLSRPHGCCIAPDGRLVVVDSENDRILAGPGDD